MILKKILYGFKILWMEIRGKQDYWHPRLEPRISTMDEFKKLYFLDFTPKGHYHFKMSKGVPIVKMNEKDTEFSITIFNYGLGLIDRFHNGENNQKKVLKILNWAIVNQEIDGAWRNYYDVPFLNIKKGWSSAMGQGLGISFICRCFYMNLISKENTLKCVLKAKNHMLSNELITSTDYGNILQEFGGTKESVLNGYIFALYGLLDYGLLTDNLTDFNKYVKTIKKILPKYKFCRYWSYYSFTKIISSGFYHQLHIDMMRSLNHITADKIFEEFAICWEKGNVFRIVFVFIKSFQKIFKLGSITSLS